MSIRSDYDYTTMSCFQTCPRRYDFRHNKGLVPKREALPLTFGGAIHKALDSWWKDRNMPKAIDLFKSAYKEDLTIDDKRTHTMGEWILNNYHAKYQDQPQELVESELKFSVKMPSGNNFIGRIDKIVRWDGVLWVVDHKTTSALGPSYTKMIEPNLQFPGYVYAAKKLGHNVVGVILDVLLVAKGLLQTASRDKLKPLLRYDSYVGEEKLAEWMSTATGIQEDILTADRQKRYVPNFDACTYYGECPYRKVCVESPAIRDRVISMDYNVEPWDPLKEDA